MADDRSSKNPAVKSTAKWWVMLTVGLGSFMVTLEASGVVVSLPTIAKAFDADLSQASWVVMAYLLTVTGTLLPMGRLGEMMGRKRLFIVGYVVFTCGLVVSALSDTLLRLILFRGIQGIGAAMVNATAPAIITETFDASERGKAFGIYSALHSLGVTTGPPVGGWLAGEISWRGIFWANLPLAFLGTLLALLIFREERKPSFSVDRFDLSSSALSFAGLLSLLLVLTRSRHGFLSGPASLGLGAASVLCLVAFVHLQRRSPRPLVHLTVFRNRRFTFGCLSLLLSLLSLSGGQFLHPFFQRRVFGYSSSLTGRILITVPLTGTLIAPLSGWLSDKISARPLCTTGLAIACAGYVGLSTLGAESTVLSWVLRLALVGAGMGIFNAPNNSSIMGALAPNQVGMAASIMSTIRVLGSVTGIALVGSVYTVSEGFYFEGMDVSGNKTAPTILAFRNAYLMPALACLIGIFLSWGVGAVRRPVKANGQSRQP